MLLTTFPDKSTLNENKTLEKLEELIHYLENCFRSEDSLSTIYQELTEKIKIITKIAEQISSKKSFDSETLQEKYTKTEDIEKKCVQIINQYQDFLATDVIEILNSIIIGFRENKEGYKAIESLNQKLDKFIQEEEYLKSELKQCKKNLRYLTKFAEEYGAQYPSVIIKLQEFINSLPKSRTDRELQILYQKLVDAVFLASERIRFQEFIKDSPEWNREEQIQKNQKTISLLREWRNQKLSEEEEQAREEHYKIFSQILENGKL